MIIRIEKNSSRPFYKQIMDGINMMIDQGALPPGSPLPSSRRLAKTLGVNRFTVTRAYEEMEALGFLQSRPGSYTRVRKKREGIPVSSRVRSLISWEKISSPEARNIYKTFLRFSPENPPLPLDQDVINISQLNLDPRLYPLNNFRKCVLSVLRQPENNILDYGCQQGNLLLRRAIAQRLQTHGINTSEDEILITNGAQQALDLVARLLSGQGTKIAVESPTYSIALPLFSFSGARLINIPFTDKGMDLGRLKHVLQREKVGFVYTIPNFHNPTGITTSPRHREDLYAVCAEYYAPLVEDGFEEDMKYFGKVPLPIKSIDSAGLVLYLGTFSKALFPGLRIGWIAADRECIGRLTAIKRFSDLSSSSFTQAVLYKFLEKGYYEKHLRRLHRIFRRRMHLALETMERYFPACIEWTHPAGGYTIWVKMPSALDEKELYTLMSRHKVVVSPGGYYFTQKIRSPYFRLSIAKTDEKEIEEGIKRAGRALMKQFERKHP
ncbi:MAG: PLP-dependent aminotransferase family protein [Candidatus Aminicenantes bacterium]|nr:PLP-dependent aminotransferase family protein [Candidatus Aminicenantes bacterium]